MAHFIKSSDLTDEQIKSLCTDALLTLVDADINSLAKRRSVTPSDIETDPLDHLVKEIGIAYLGKRICVSRMGINPQAYSNGVEIDVYSAKLSFYQKEISRLEPMITAEVLLGTADESSEFSAEVPLYRG